ncbi:MAG: RhuM family protein [Chromatocurvus sp.]
MSNIVIFEAEGQPVQVRLEGETVWLSQSQIAELFTVTPQNVTMHLKNIYAEYELVEHSTCKDFLQVQTEGDREVKRKRKHYNLDAIISVGYRVNSRRATQFCFCGISD